MDDRFVTLASLVAGAPAANAPVAVPLSGLATSAPVSVRPVLDLARADIAQELALVRLAALEAFERASADLMARLADDVLGRELALAPVDLAAIAARALARFAEYEPVALAVAPDDVAAFDSPLPVRADASLDAGDLTIEVADGAFETRFTLRVRETVTAVLAESNQ